MLENLLKPLWHFEEESVKLSDSTVKSIPIDSKMPRQKTTSGDKQINREAYKKNHNESIELQEDTLRLIEKVVSIHIKMLMDLRKRLSQKCRGYRS